MRLSTSKTTREKRKSRRYEVPLFLSGNGFETIPVQNWSYDGFAAAAVDEDWKVGDRLSFTIAATPESEGGLVSARVLRATETVTAFAFEGLSNDAFDAMESGLRSKLSH